MPTFSLFSARAWLERLDASRHALPLLFLASMLETLIVPIPIEVILIPWMLHHPRRKWVIAGVALAGNLTAAVAGFYLGALAMEAWGEALIAWSGSQSAYDAFQARFQEDGFMAILAIAIVPVPFQIAMLVAGASGYALSLFMLAAMLARGARYFGLAALVALAGEAALRLWKRFSRPLGLLGTLLLAAWLWAQFGP